MPVRLLLVAANEEARAGLAQRLGRSSEIELLGAVHDAREAKALASDRPDLVLVDVQEGDGYDRTLCQELVEAFRSPVVVLTSFMTRARWNELRKAGVVTYLERHVDTRRLADELTQVAHQYAGSQTSKEHEDE